MAEYIEREGLLKWMKEEKPKFLIEHGYLHGITVGFDYALKFVEQMPSADVVEVVHASWVWGKVCGSKGYCCTNCGAGFVGENAEWIAKEHDYCPKCGAKMDGDKK